MHTHDYFFYKVKINYDSTPFCLLVDIAILIEFDVCMGMVMGDVNFLISLRAAEIMFISITISIQANTIKYDNIKFKW